MKSPKLEIRSPKEARSPNSEMPRRHADLFGFRISDFLRVSGFGFRIYFLILVFVASSALARINVVTLPERDTVQLTIYNSVDLTLVKETRHLTFRKGLNRLEFSWANTLIDPTSVEFKALSHADEVEILDVSFPPRVPNTLEWRINSEFAGEVVAEILYFTSGIKWSADYVVESARNEAQMTLSGAVRVNNNSGEDYENAQVRLVVGVIRLVEEIAQLARLGEAQDESLSQLLKRKPAVAGQLYSAARGRRLKDAGAFGGGSGGMAADKLSVKEIVKEGVSEYFLYTVEGRDTIQNGWSKRLPSFRTEKVPITSYYKFEKERWGEAVMRYYRFTNSTPSQLGNEPLPDGAVKAFRVTTDDALYAYVGGTSVKYIPVNESVDLELGNDPEVTVKATMMDWEKTNPEFDAQGNVAGWTTKETWDFEVQNSKEIPIVLDIRRNFSGDWTITTDAKNEKVDANKVKFIVPLKPREKQRFSYSIVTQHGTRSRR